MKVAFLVIALLTVALTVQAHLLHGGGGVGTGGGVVVPRIFTSDFTADFN